MFAPSPQPSKLDIRMLILTLKRSLRSNTLGIVVDLEALAVVVHRDTRGLMDVCVLRLYIGPLHFNISLSPKNSLQVDG